MERHHITSQKENKLKSAPVSAIIMATAFYDDRGVILVKFLPRENSKLSLLYCNTKKSECLPLSRQSHRKNVRNVASPWHTRVSTNDIIKKFAQTLLLLISQSHFHLISLLKDELWGYHYKMMRHWKMPCLSSWRKWRMYFTGWEHMLLFESGNRLLAKMKSTVHRKMTMPSAML